MIDMVVTCACGHPEERHDDGCGECDCPEFHDTVRMIPTTINSRWTVSLPSHRAYRPEWRTGWEVERWNSVADLLRPGGVFVDVGTEEGDLTAIAAQIVGPTGGVVMVEPNPLVWPNIRAIWEANVLAPPAATFVGFAADVTDLAPPLCDFDPAMIGTWPACAFGPLVGDHGFRVLAQQAASTPRIRLDDLYHTAVTGLSIDVEGAEWDVLNGAHLILDLDRPDVWVSVHPAALEEWYGKAPGDVDALMAGHGYDATFLAEDHEVHMLYTPEESR